MSNLLATIGLTTRTRCSREQVADLVANGGQRAVLNLDQFVLDQHVNAIPSQRRFGPRMVAGVTLLELAMERRFHAEQGTGVGGQGLGSGMPAVRCQNRESSAGMPT